MWHTTKEVEGAHVPVAERFRHLGRIGRNEDRVGLRQVDRKEVDLALDAADNANRFAAIHLSMTRRMHQRHEHLLCPLTPTSDEVLCDRYLARETVHVAQSLENTL
jgi:hypothetical protein